jgi:hypothetical protein
MEGSRERPTSFGHVETVKIGWASKRGRSTIHLRDEEWCLFNYIVHPDVNMVPGMNESCKR